jgi:hypothetical protein
MVVSVLVVSCSRQIMKRKVHSSQKRNIRRHGDYIYVIGEPHTTFSYNYSQFSFVQIEKYSKLRFKNKGGRKKRFKGSKKKDHDIRKVLQKDRPDERLT